MFLIAKERKTSENRQRTSEVFKHIKEQKMYNIQADGQTKSTGAFSQSIILCNL